MFVRMVRLKKMLKLGRKLNLLVSPLMVNILNSTYIYALLNASRILKEYGYPYSILQQ